MAPPANREFQATPTEITTNTTTPAFKIPTGDHIRGGFEALLSSVSFSGSLDGATVTLQVKVGGVWRATALTLTAGAPLLVLHEANAPRAEAFRFSFAGGGGSIAAHIWIACRTALVFI